MSSEDTLSDAEIAKLRGTFMLDQKRAAHSDRVQTAKDDADVVAVYYKRLKERGVPAQHALTLADGYQVATVTPWMDE